MTELLIGLAGVLVGALIQFYLNKRSSSEAHYLQLKSEACMEYLNAVATSTFRQEEAQERIAAAKGRLCVVGDAAILERIVAVDHANPDLSDPNAQQTFIELVQEMRARGIAVGEVTKDDIQVLLFGSDRRKESFRSSEAV